jgi:hypothetical protein
MLCVVSSLDNSRLSTELLELQAKCGVQAEEASDLRARVAAVEADLGAAQGIAELSKAEVNQRPRAARCFSHGL